MCMFTIGSGLSLMEVKIFVLMKRQDNSYLRSINQTKNSLALGDLNRPRCERSSVYALGAWQGSRSARRGRRRCRCAGRRYLEHEPPQHSGTRRGTFWRGARAEMRDGSLAGSCWVCLPGRFAPKTARFARERVPKKIKTFFLRLFLKTFF